LPLKSAALVRAPQALNRHHIFPATRQTSAETPRAAVWVSPPPPDPRTPAAQLLAVFHRCRHLEQAVPFRNDPLVFAQGGFLLRERTMARNSWEITQVNEPG